MFLTVDDDSVKLRGHLMHRGEPNKTWKSDVFFGGVVHPAGSPKPDLIGDYTDARGGVHRFDGVIDGTEDCPRPTTPPPPPPPHTVNPSGSFTTECTATGARADVGALSEGGLSGGAFYLIGTGFEQKVTSGQQDVTVPVSTTIRLEHRRAGSATRTLDTEKSPAACPAGGGVQKTANPADGSVVEPGTTIAYTVTVLNTGRVALTDRPVVDTLPSYVSVVAGTVSGGGVVSSDGRTITWSVTLAADATRTFTYTGLVDANAPPGTVLVNRVTFEGQTDTTSHPVGSRDLRVVKAVSPTGAAEFGDVLTYSLTVQASGTQTQHDVTVTDTIPAGTSYVLGSVACTGGCAGTPTVASGVITWPLGTMAPGTTRTVSFQVTIDTPPAGEDGSIPAVEIRNSGAVRSAEVGPVPSNEVRTPVVAVQGVKHGHPGKGPGAGPGASPGAPGTPVTDVAGTDNGILPHTGLGSLTWLLALAGLILVGVGVAARSASRARG